MKKFLAILMAICMMASMLCVSAFAADSDPIVMEISGLEKDGKTIVSLNYWTKFDEGWEKAVDLACDNAFMEEHDLDRIIVDLRADWNANEDGEFGKSSWDGFQYSTIYVPSDTRITINLNGHNINRGLGDNNEYDGEVIYVDDNADLIINGGKDGDPIVKSSENTEGIPMGMITGGNSDNGAGGIHIMDGAKVTLNNVNLIGNAVDDDDGSAIAAYDGAVLVMNGGSVSNNTLWRSFKSYVTPYGAIYLNDATGYFNNVEFADNIFRGHDYAYGVAIGSDDSDLTLENCTFKHNGYKNASNNIWTPQSVIEIEGGTVNIKNCVFENNGTNGNLIGPDLMRIEDADATITGSVFCNNWSEIIIRCYSVKLEVTDCHFEGNSGNVFHGEAKEGSFFKNCTFTNNSQGSYWTFVFEENNKLTFEDCEIDDDASFKNKNNATFITNGRAKSLGVGSIFGEGSLAMIVSFLALITSGVCIFLTVYYNKKKAVPVAANNAIEAEDEE